uniref:Uncharacterized protein n=1 Tax=Nothoprocta perdicaria TaxID=30464 RepID=A0A8C7A584_NOTPE
SDKMAAAAEAPGAPVCVLVLGPGRAGAPPALPPRGPTPLVSPQRLAAQLQAQRCPPYVINLDPAVRELPFAANIGHEVY